MRTRKHQARLLARDRARPLARGLASWFIPLPNSPAWDLLVDYERPNSFTSSAEIDSCLAAPGITVTREGPGRPPGPSGP
ncbi:hypothetical protein [Streptomyces syringium]|uniref:hypothetical protein n=1 Tax=Streptomyces syringium TaxID=76729 RepID=UPI003453A4E0